MLWILPAALLPVVIHLLNRLRYRTVRWGAMMFLVRAARASTRHARLRHYLILAARTLALLAFLLVVARPITGGWLGRTLAGPPETVVLLLDRSASMEALDPAAQTSRRARALEQFAAVAREAYAGSRFVLIDSATREPHEIAGPNALPALALAGPTDTAADLPALFAAAAEYLARGAAGRAEIWAASDLQASDWRPDSAAWTALSARLAALPQGVRVRVLALTGSPPGNRALALREASLRGAGTSRALDLALTLSADRDAEESIPVVVTLDGVRTVSEVRRSAARLDWTLPVELPADSAAGWGRVELPADTSPRDHSVHFVYGPPAPLKAIVVSDREADARRFAAAAAPRPGPARAGEWRRPPEMGDPGDAALVIWIGRAPSGEAAATLERFAAAGGSVLFLPPADDAPPPAGDEETAFSWGEAETAPPERPFRVATWEDIDGPLARTADGRPLPVDRLAIVARRGVVWPDAVRGEWNAVASCSDGPPFLLRRTVGDGVAYLCTGRPAAGWTDGDEGRVLVPLVQRLLARGGRRLGATVFAEAGAWRADGGERWMSADGEARDPMVEAGTYRLGDRWLALNRPASEDRPAALDPSRVEGLLSGVPVAVTEAMIGERAPARQSEIWPLLAVLALLFLAVEALLLLGDRAVPADAPKPTA
jgi:hypothetical protein